MGSREGGGRRPTTVWAVVAAVAAVVLAAAGTVWLWPRSSSSGASNAGPARSSAAFSASPTVSASASAAPTGAGPTSAAGQPPAGQQAGAPKPVISKLTGAANGLIVTMSLTFTAQADRGPFTCNLRWAQTQEFGCTPGTVTRTYEIGFTGGFELFGIVTDRFGVRSEQFDGWVDVPAIAPPTYSDPHVAALHDDDPVATGVLVEFQVEHAPGDHPRCEITIGAKRITIDPCENYISHFEQLEPTGKPVVVSLALYSRAPVPPVPPDMLASVTV